MATQQLKNIVVIGAGVVGLTTALKIQEKGGYRVTIVAEVLPTDPKTIKYTSQWAGAQHATWATDERQKEMDYETFKIMWDLSAPGTDTEACFLRCIETDYADKEWEKPHSQEQMPEFQYLPKESLKHGAIAGKTFSTLTIDCPVYLLYLYNRFLKAGGAVIQGTVGHVNDLAENGLANVGLEGKVTSAPHEGMFDAIVVCTGLGTRFLGGVNDMDMFPIRGQTLLVKAPWVRDMRNLDRLTSEGWFSYTIPRRSGDVVVGGTFDNNDWEPQPKKDISESILTHALVLCPELAPPEVRTKRVPTIEDIRPLITEECCGLRPGRKGGIRLEVELLEGKGKERKVPLVFNYGHGGWGYQSSWGSASMALKLLEQALAKI